MSEREKENSETPENNTLSKQYTILTAVQERPTQAISRYTLTRTVPYYIQNLT